MFHLHCRNSLIFHPYPKCDLWTITVSASLKPDVPASGLYLLPWATTPPRTVKHIQHSTWICTSLNKIFCRGCCMCLVSTAGLSTQDFQNLVNVDQPVPLLSALWFSLAEQTDCLVQQFLINSLILCLHFPYNCIIGNMETVPNWPGPISLYFHTDFY